MSVAQNWTIMLYRQGHKLQIGNVPITLLEVFTNICFNKRGGISIASKLSHSGFFKY